MIQECSPFQTESDGLVNIVIQAVIPENIKVDILRSKEAGKKAYKEFGEKHISGPANPWDKMTKLKLQTWNSASKTY